MLDVNGDVDAGRKIELLELIDRLGRGLNDINEAFVRAGLELLHRFLVHVGRAIDGEFLDARGQRDGAGDTGAGAFGGLDDILGGLIDHSIVEALEFDANALAFHGVKKNGGLAAGRALGVGFDNLGEERVWHLFEVRRRDACTGASLGERPDVSHIPEE